MIREEIEDMKREVQDLKSQSLAFDILHDYKKQNKRQFVIMIVILTMWFATIGYLVYILNDVGVIEETTSQEISDVEKIENSNITNGDSYGESKANKNN